MNTGTDFIFYSDTNLQHALDELDLMAADFNYHGSTITVSAYDMAAMGDSIKAIVKEHGGELSG